MKESTLKPVKTTIRILTGLSFLLFIAYQLFLMMQLPEQRFGRLIGIILYLFITVASFFALSHNRVIRVLRSVFFKYSDEFFQIIRGYSQPVTPFGVVRFIHW